MSKRRKDLREIEIPDGVSVEVDGLKVKVRGPLGEIEREFKVRGVVIEKADNKIIVRAVRNRRKFLANTGTVWAHIRNMIKGVQKEWVYRLRVVYSHFPIKVRVEGDKVLIENFLGEKVPRVAKIMPGAKVEIKGKDIIVKSIDIEAAGQTAANLEIATRKRPDLDERKFQDGIYIIGRGWGEA